MRLLYCYAEFYDSNGKECSLRGLDAIEVCFSAKDNFSFDKAANVLRRRDRATPLPDNFWSNSATDTNIYNVNVIVGANGSGKTTVINYIIDLLNYIYHDFGKSLDENDRRTRYNPSNDRCILLFEDDGERCMLDTAKGKPALPPDGFAAWSPELVTERLRHTKLINMTNTLNQRDYELHIGGKNHRLRDYFVYDCTLGATIGPEISLFFIYEVYKQVKFVFGRCGASQYNIHELRIPNALKFRLRTDRFKDYFDVPKGEPKEDTSFTDQLGRLCVTASLDNFALAKGISLNGNAKRLFGKNILNAHSLMEQISSIKKLLGVFAVSGAKDNILRVWNIGTEACLQAMKGHTRLISCVAMTEDGLCVSGAFDKTLRVWDLNTGTCLKTLDGHTDSIRCIAVTKDGLCVSGSYDKTLRLWNIRNGDCLQILREHTGKVRSVTVTEDGLCVSGSSDRTLRVWDLRTGKCLNILRGHTGSVNCVAVTKDGLCVSGSVDNTLRVWDLRTGKCLRTLDGHAGSVRCVAVTGDGKHCVSGSGDGTLRVWDLHTGNNLHTMARNTGPVYCVTTTEDGLCISGARNNTLYVWDLQTGKCLRTLKGHTDALTGVATFRDRTGDSAVELLKESCDAYLQFLDDNKDGLFSKIRYIDGDNYELSIEAISDNKALYEQLGAFIQLYMDTCKPHYTIDFDWGLSSGEENMLRIFTWLHHIFPLDEPGGGRVIRNNEEYSEGGGEDCDSVLLFMDEADLTLHPEWQRKLISILMAFIPQIYPVSVAKDIQLVLSTHSPLLLGDIPRENILYLPEKEQERSTAVVIEPPETFGQNIHTILREGFFLKNGTVGEFAATKINAAAKRLEELADPKVVNQPTEDELREIRQVTNLVAAGILRTRLEVMLRNAERRFEENGAEDDRRALRALIDKSNLSDAEKARLMRALQSGGEGT